MTEPRPAGPQPVVPTDVAKRIRRPAPPDCHVVPGSLPVVSFGDPGAASVASLSLNPSWGELLDSQRR